MQPTQSFHSSALMGWLGFVVVGCWGYHEIAEKEFTAVLTLSVMVQALAFSFLQMQISNSRSVSGISGKALTMHAIKLCCRLCSSLFLDGYLPTDKSGDWIYQLGDVLSLLMVLQILYSVYGAYKASYQFEADTLDIRNLIMGAVVLAVLIHPDMNSWATMVSNFLSGLFWFHASPDLVEDEKSLNVPGLAINGAHIVQMILLLDFGYYYGRAFLQGKGCAPTMHIGGNAVNI